MRVINLIASDLRSAFSFSRRIDPRDVHSIGRVAVFGAVLWMTAGTLALLLLMELGPPSPTWAIPPFYWVPMFVLVTLGGIGYSFGLAGVISLPFALRAKPREASLYLLALSFVLGFQWLVVLNAIESTYGFRLW